MRDLPPNLAAALASGVTTLCRCWLLTRRDGVTLGFTDHDRDIRVGGTLFEAASGLDASATEAERGLATGGGDVTGVLSSARIVPEEIEAGLYDGARLKSWLVDWANPALDFLLEAVTLGEIRRSDEQFIAETRNLFHALDQQQGRLYTAGCTAELGDARCGINLAGSRYSAATTVLTTDGAMMVSAPAFSNFQPGFFTRGLLRFTSGALKGVVVSIKEHQPGGVLRLWQPLARAPAIGDGISASAGCDKRFETCRDRFNNALNFQGFPYIPAPDFVFSYAVPGEGTHQGRPLVR